MISLMCIFGFVGLIVLLILLFWYTCTILKKLLFVSKNIYRLSEVFEYFRSHLKSLYELETFYGDQEIKNLIVHSKDVIEEIEKFRDIYILSEDGELEEIIIELDKEEEETQIANNKKEKEEE